MINNQDDIVVYGALCASLFLVIKSAKTFLQQRKLRKRIENLPIHTSSSGASEGELVLLKIKCQKSDAIDFNLDIGSNQLMYGFRVRILQERMRSQFNKISQKTAEKGLLWVDKENKARKMPRIIDIDLLQYKNVQYQSLFEGQQRPGIFGCISKFTLAALAANSQPMPFQRKQIFNPMVKGPHFGTLTATVSLVANIPFIICCEIKDGQLLPLVAGLSKHNILENLVYNENLHLFYVAQYGVFAAFVGLFVWYVKKGYIKAKLQKWKILIKQWLKDDKKGPKLLQTEVGEDQTCIICYQNCRNVIFTQCKHFLICRQCLYDENNHNIACPVCRDDIGGVVEVKECQRPQ